MVSDQTGEGLLSRMVVGVVENLCELLGIEGFWQAEETVREGRSAGRFR